MYGRIRGRFFAFRESPPSPGMKGQERNSAQYAYHLDQYWTAAVYLACCLS